MLCERAHPFAPCEINILERRQSAARRGRKAGWEYYVHFRGLNRRLDEWVSHDRLHPIERRQRVGERPRGTHELAGLRASYNLDVVAAGSGAQQPEGEDALDERTLKEHERAFGKIKNISRIAFGNYEIDAWYSSPYSCVPNGALCEDLFICERCLRPHTIRERLCRHEARCAMHHPPGDEIYREAREADAHGKVLSVFIVDGALSPAYCQRLCLLGKLFLDHKLIWRTPQHFLFAVLCEWDERGCHLIGYFSRQKGPGSGAPLPHTLACLLVLPPHQRKNYGVLLISLSYELARREGWSGAPERPLSDLGLKSYRAYWAAALLRVLATAARKGEALSVLDLSERTAICQPDVLATLHSLRLLRYAAGAHSLCVPLALLVRHGLALPAGAGGPSVVDERQVRSQRPGGVFAIDTAKLQWPPAGTTLPGAALLAKDEASPAFTSTDAGAALAPGPTASRALRQAPLAAEAAPAQQSRKRKAAPPAEEPETADVRMTLRSARRATGAS